MENCSFAWSWIEGLLTFFLDKSMPRRGCFEQTDLTTFTLMSLSLSFHLSLSLTHTHTNALRHTLNPHPETHIPSCLHFYLYLDVFLLLNPNLFIISLSVICFLHLVRFSVFMFWCPLFPAFGKYRFNKSFRIAKDSLTLKENFCKKFY